MTYEYYPLQNTLPFLDLLPVEENLSAEITALKTVASNSDATIETILARKDATLLFMTMAVSMTSKNEMPIVRAYTGDIPTDIRGIHRAGPQKLYHVAPHFYVEDSRIMQYWNKPFETETLLSNFKVSIGMDFSMTNEMTRPQKMYASFLNKLWVAWL